MVCVELSEEMSDSSTWHPVQVGCNWSSVQAPAISWAGMWSGGVVVLSQMPCISSWRIVMEDHLGLVLITCGVSREGITVFCS